MTFCSTPPDPEHTSVLSYGQAQDNSKRLGLPLAPDKHTLLNHMTKEGHRHPYEGEEHLSQVGAQRIRCKWEHHVSEKKKPHFGIQIDCKPVQVTQNFGL